MLEEEETLTTYCPQTIKPRYGFWRYANEKSRVGKEVNFARRWRYNDASLFFVFLSRISTQQLQMNEVTNSSKTLLYWIISQTTQKHLRPDRYIKWYSVLPGLKDTKTVPVVSPVFRLLETFLVDKNRIEFRWFFCIKLYIWENV